MNNKWQPITIDKIYGLIIDDESKMNFEEIRIWDAIKVDLIKWKESKYGKLGGGFWIAGLIGNRVLRYNDIEDGWNISTWKTYGEIKEYCCNQDNLISAIHKIKYIITERSVKQ